MAAGRRSILHALAMISAFAIHSDISTVFADAPASQKLPDGFVLKTPTIPIELVGSLKTINERLSDGVIPADNAVVWMMYAFGPEVIEPVLLEYQLESLGIAKLPDDSSLFVRLPDFTLSTGLTGDEAYELALVIQSQLFHAGEKIWSAEEFPQVSAYLAANQRFLEIISQSARCSSYYAPVLSAEEPPRILSADLGVERRLEFVIRMFVARALGQLSEGHLEGTIQDLATAKKLAYLLAHGSPFDVSVAKAHMLDSIIFRAESQILSSDRASLEVLQALKTLEKSIPAFPPASRAIDIGERSIVHQEIELLSVDLPSLEGFFETPQKETDLPPTTIKLPTIASVIWELAINEADQIWDQIRDAIGNKDRQQQTIAFQNLDRLYAAWAATDDSSPEKFEKELSEFPETASRSIGRNMAFSLRPLWAQRQATDDRYQVRRDLLLIQNALIEYRFRNGELPHTLDDLVPETLTQLPRDAHSQKPYSYVQHPDGLTVLMSFGMNKEDDSGKIYNDDQVIYIRD